MSGPTSRPRLAVPPLVVAIGIMITVATIGSCVFWRSLQLHEKRSALGTLCRAESLSIPAKGCEEVAAVASLRSAVANEASVDLAYWQLALNLIGLLAGGVTVYLAYAAWCEARRSADAAQATLEDTRKESSLQNERYEVQIATATLAAQAAQKSADTLAAAERAYVLFHDTRDVFAGNGTLERIDLLWKNFGKSPAFVTEVRFGWGAQDPFPNPKETLPLPVPMGAVIDAGGTWPRGHISDTATLFALKNAGHPVYLFGQITYRDIHQVERHSWFCRLFTGQKFILGLLHDPELNGYD